MTVAVKLSQVGTLDMRLEVIVIPVSNVDRAKQFYGDLGGGSTPISLSMTVFA